jgi:DNA polymerase-3 subunit gamma/tau
MAGYEVLARRYRPKGFDEVVGQEAVGQALRNAIGASRVGHAYLFAGPRGVGKTSTARILARALNCMGSEGPTPDPCGRCDACREIVAGADPDVVEMDAASNRGIDDARSLRETLSLRPLRDRFRVYIVDECHQLTTHAWDALLKTLEETPAHVRFVLATTSLPRVPETIRSRCQVFEFRRIGEAEIVRRLDQIAKAEGFSLAGDVARAVAAVAAGGMRDAQSLLDQLVSLAGPAPKLADLHRLLGTADSEGVAGLFDRVAEKDRAGLLRSLDALFASGVSEEGLLDASVEHLRTLLLLAVCGPEFEPLRAREGEERLRALAGRASRFPPQRLEEMAESILVARRRLREAPAVRRSVVELAFLRLARWDEFGSEKEWLDRLEALERKLQGAGDLPAAAASARRTLRPPGSPRGDLKARLVAAIGARSPVAAEALSRARLVEDGSGGTRVETEGLDESDRRMLESPRTRAWIEEALAAAASGPAPPRGTSAPRGPGAASILDRAADEVAKAFGGEITE